MSYDIRPLNSINRTCEILEISKPTVYAMVQRKQLDMVKVGKLSRITGESLQRIVAEGTPKAA
ncbi:MAG: helix-turn-helix domain-containing protein [Alphaproteobacteria bacterium]